MTAREKILTTPPGMVHPIEGKKAIRYSANKMFVPSPAQVREAILNIPKGMTKSIDQIRADLAAAHDAGVTCPMAATKGWFLVAKAADEELEEGIEEVAPWWRITREGRPDPRLPGGTERHRALLLAEDVRI